MWCKTCNIETNEDLCPVCGSATIEDIPTEVYWCAHCETPVIQAATQADKGFCPLCKRKMKYLSADLRPVFPEERLLLELLLGEKPFTYVEKSVWAANSRYYINGKSVSIPSKTFQEADTDALSKMLEQNKGQNTYEYFNDGMTAFFSLSLAHRALEVLSHSDFSGKDIPEMHSKTIEFLLKRGTCICGTHLDPGTIPYNKVSELMDYLPPQSIGVTVGQFIKDSRSKYSKEISLYQDIAEQVSLIRK